MLEIILIHSPLVGPSSLLPTADALKAQGIKCATPSPLRPHAPPPSWHDWPIRLKGAVPDMASAVVVGHSMGGLLAARLAADIHAAGFICLDARIPPASGPTQPVEPEFHDFLRTLPLSDGHLPPWQDWWEVDAFEGADISEDTRKTVLSDIPSLPLSWFDDAFEMPDWSGIRKGFVRTSHTFIDEARRAEADGWPVIRLKGTHLHPATKPEETAQAIIACCADMQIT
ncbi:MAG: alpha/beta fold hydrolase [Candidatus Phaeomarinobacter sp.]